MFGEKRRAGQSRLERGEVSGLSVQECNHFGHHWVGLLRQRYDSWFKMFETTLRFSFFFFFMYYKYAVVDSSLCEDSVIVSPWISLWFICVLTSIKISAYFRMRFIVSLRSFPWNGRDPVSISNWTHTHTHTTLTIWKTFIAHYWFFQLADACEHAYI